MIARAPSDLGHWTRQYEALLARYVDQTEVGVAARARELGRALATVRVSIADLAQIHARALLDAHRAAAGQQNGIDEPAGRLLADVAAAFDEQRSTEQPLLHSFVDDTSDGVYRMDATGCVVYANQGAADIAGCRIDELVGRSYAPFVAPAQLEEAYRIVQRVLTGESIEHEIELANGKTCQFIARPVRGEGGAVVGIFGLARDVTAQRAAEQALRASEARYRSLFENVPVGLYRTTPDGRILDANRALIEMLGYPDLATLARGHVADLYVDPSQRQPLLDALERTGAAFGTEIRMWRHDGREVRVNDHSRVVRDVAGHAQFYEGSLVDVTARAQADEELQRHRERLAQLVEERTEELENANARLRRELAERRQIEQLLRAQRDLSAALGAAEDVTTALAALLDGVLSTQTLDCGGVYVMDEKAGTLRLVVHRNLSPEFVGQVSCLAADTPQAQFVRAGQAAYEENCDFSVTPELLRQERILSLACIPVRCEGRVVACMNLASRTHATIAKTTRHALEAIAARAGGVMARIRARQALRASEEKFRVLVETVSAAAFITRDNRIVYANSAAERLCGAARDALEGRRFEDLIDPTDRPAVLEEMLAAVRPRRRRAPCEAQLIRPPGPPPWVEVAASTIEFGGQPAVLITAFDVTERKQAEEAVHEAQERMQLALRGADLGLWDWNIITNEVVFNDRWAEMLGYQPDEIAPAYATWESHVHPDDLPVVLKQLHDHMAGRSPLYQCEQRLRCKNGDWKWVLATGRVVRRDAQGRPLRATGTHHDITDRKRADEAAQQHHEQLAHVARVSTLGEMASGLAHELAQPLSAILYYARGGKARLDAGTWGTTDAARTLEKVAAQAERAGEFIRRLKAFVRKAQPHRVPTDINDIVHDAISLVANEARSNLVSIRMELEKDLPAVAVDRIQIEQVILNLVRNGIEAMNLTPPGEREISVRTTGGAGAVCVTVKDAGRGIAEQIAHEIFDPFFTTKAKGTGLGLSISRTIIEETHGGSLWARPDPTGGTIFGFNLPIGEEARDRE